MPLVWFGLFENKNVIAIDGPLSSPALPGRYALGDLTPSIDRGRFEAAFGRIKQHLVEGDSYQVNFTFRMRGPFEGDARSLFADLVEAQQGRHSAFVHIGSHSICSASPELFFALDGLDVSARPMKGTARRGRTLAEDRTRGDHLRSSQKQRAENVMIVDMVRNDLGRIADVGSVQVPELFTLERYPNVWQMTSLVTGRSRAALGDVFAALHPSASVTGAPKVRTMEILKELEGEPRGVYTGAVGHVRPDGNARFSVAIRTAVVDHRRGSVEFGIGSGIVWDSDPEEEYEECLLKGSVLGQRPAPFDLLETLRWRPDEGFWLLDRHLRRLSDSAEYFGFPCRRDEVERTLRASVGSPDGPMRVRLLLSKDGTVRVEAQPLIATGPVKIRLAPEPIDVEDRFLFHKTTNRATYERLCRVDGGGCDDVVLWNRKGQVTETTIANLVVEIGGTLVTPPVECGLLAGTCRAEMLDRGELREAPITIGELRAAPRFWLINSVQGRRPAVWEQ